MQKEKETEEEEEEEEEEETHNWKETLLSLCRSNLKKHVGNCSKENIVLKFMKHRVWLYIYIFKVDDLTCLRIMFAQTQNEIRLITELFRDAFFNELK
jgi:hypothetical protein